MADTETVALEGHAQTDFDESGRKSLLRFLTCGSVDDGKSTLIGRLLYESQRVLEDQLAALKRDSKRVGTCGEALDFALLVDGLAAEREQGITIDVAYRYFSTARRSFIVADTPGHEQYTRNMATGASTADVAVLMIDARKGLLTQTRRHAFIAAMLGVREIVACVNKMDLIGYDEQAFNAIERACRELAGELGLERFLAIPVCAVDGDTVVARSPAMPWYDGPPLLQHLEEVEVDAREQGLPLRMPVQWVNRPHADFRGYCGRVESGILTPGDPVKVMPSGKDAVVARIVGMGGDHAMAVAGQSVTLTLDREIDIARGDVIVSAEDPCAVADQFEVRLSLDGRGTDAARAHLPDEGRRADAVLHGDDAQGRGGCHLL
jgi:bifunctional enzyme CysN/CysC